MGSIEIKRIGYSIVLKELDNKQLLFNKFIIYECLKKDEHSAVYIGSQKNQTKKQIIKVLDSKNLPDDSILERFKREAKILSQLKHPNIINVFEYGIHLDSFYISYEYFEGQNLRQIIKSDKLNIDEKIKILTQLFNGLAFAHENQVIHRDIKPENIIISDSLKVKIIDFGLAQGFSDNFVTTQNAIVGTPSYMSPEQILGDKLTSQSDLFSAGIVTYELLINTNPFLGRDVNETINNIISFDENSDLLKTESLPGSLQSIVKNLIKSDKSTRFQSANQVLELLGYTLNSKERKIFSKKKRKTNLIAAASIIVIIISSFLIYYYFSQTQKENPIILFTKDSVKIPILTIERKNEDTVKNTMIEKTEPKPEESNIAQKQEEKPVSNENNIVSIKKSGELFIECIPWAYIYLDSNKVETTPLKNPLNITEGEHQLELIHPNYPKYSSRIIISSDKRTTLRINLDTLFGYLDCKVYPWSEVIINSKTIGQTPFQKPLRLTPGIYDVTLKNNNFNPITFNIKITRNETYLLKYNFEKGN